ncbi:hypothetical protein VM1G_11796 [Cytospora mali]|uniref:Uncharacterized protein n=1 Tax=Cytospora mali TaxID=578113 RepID=A0A194W735_CYTMA|nr:hypothetical protein VM1G_11796 [Valsa mali]
MLRNLEDMCSAAEKSLAPKAEHPVGGRLWRSYCRSKGGWEKDVTDHRKVGNAQKKEHGVVLLLPLKRDQSFKVG